MVDVKLYDFLAAYYPDEHEPIRFRTFAPKGYPKVAEKCTPKPFGNLYATEFTVTRSALKTNKAVRSLVLSENKYKGVYFLPNAGISEAKRLNLGELAQSKREDGKLIWTQYVEDDDITRFNAFFAEDDNKSIDEQLLNLESCPLKPSIIVITCKSAHGYWLCASGVTRDQWADTQLRLIAYFGSDGSIKNPSRVMRLPNLNHISYDPASKSVECKLVEVAHFEPDRIYTYEEMSAAFPAVESSNGDSWQPPAPGHGEYRTWEELGNELRRRMYAHPTAHRQGEKIVLKGVCHNGKGDSALFFNTITGKYHCDNEGCRKEDILPAFGLPEKPNGGDGWGSSGKVKSLVARAPRLTDKAWTEDPVQVEFAKKIKAALEPVALIEREPEKVEADLCPVCQAPLRWLVLDRCDAFACSVDESHHSGSNPKELDSTIPTICPRCAAPINWLPGESQDTYVCSKDELHYFVLTEPFDLSAVPTVGELDRIPKDVDEIAGCYNGACGGLLEFQKGRAHCVRCDTDQVIVG